MPHFCLTYIITLAQSTAPQNDMATHELWDENMEGADMDEKPQPGRTALQQPRTPMQTLEPSPTPTLLSPTKREVSFS